MLTYDVEPGSHVVHFYADDEKLAASIADYAAEGLRVGEAFVMIAEPEHRAAVRDALGARGVDMEAGPAAGIHVLDASATLSGFMEDGAPDAERFATVLSGALRAAAVGRAGVRAYGEMVEVLWRAGNVNGALSLEELWNDLAGQLPFSLYCAYRETLLDAAGAEALDAACRAHSAVLADGALASRSSETARFHADAHAPTAARAFVADVLRAGAGEDTELLDNAALAISELATNAVRYGGGAFSVTVTSLADAVRISVRDETPELPEPRHSSPEDPRGRGLHIVGALSRDWGTIPRLDGKIVWAELARA